MPNRLQKRQIDQILGLVFWVIFERAKIPEGSERLKFFALLRGEPKLGLSMIEAALRALHVQMPTNPLSLNILEHGFEHMSKAIHGLAVNYQAETEGIILLQLLPLWAAAGFPKVVLDNKFIESLSEPDLTSDQVGASVLPFTAFRIQLPARMFSSTTGGKSYYLDQILVGKMLKSFKEEDENGIEMDGYAILSEADEFALWGASPNLSGIGMGPRADLDPSSKGKDYVLTFEDEDARSMYRFGQIAARVCKAFQEDRVTLIEGPRHVPNLDAGDFPDVWRGRVWEATTSTPEIRVSEGDTNEPRTTETDE